MMMPESDVMLGEFLQGSGLSMAFRGVVRSAMIAAGNRDNWITCDDQRYHYKYHVNMYFECLWRKVLLGA